MVLLVTDGGHGRSSQSQALLSPGKCCQDGHLLFLPAQHFISLLLPMPPQSSVEEPPPLVLNAITQEEPTLVSQDGHMTWPGKMRGRPETSAGAKEKRGSPLAQQWS